MCEFDDIENVEDATPPQVVALSSKENPETCNGKVPRLALAAAKREVDYDKHYKDIFLANYKTACPWAYFQDNSLISNFDPIWHTPENDQP